MSDVNDGTVKNKGWLEKGVGGLVSSSDSSTYYYYAHTDFLIQT